MPVDVLFVAVGGSNAGDALSSVCHPLYRGRKEVDEVTRHEHAMLPLSCILNSSAQLEESERVTLARVWFEGRTVIFGGGGLINHEPHWNLLINAAIAFSKCTILYGIGQNRHHGDDSAMAPLMLDNENVLYGLRDWNGNEESYVPCPTCLILPEEEKTRKRSIGILRHAWFPMKFDKDDVNKDTLSEILPVSMSLNLFSPQQIFDYIASSECILTNTYHGYYWSILMGKRALLHGAFSDKFDFFKCGVTKYVAAVPIEQQFDALESQTGFREGCVQRNLSFLAKIKERLE